MDRRHPLPRNHHATTSPKFILAAPGAVRAAKRVFEGVILWTLPPPDAHGIIGKAYPQIGAPLDPPDVAASGRTTSFRHRRDGGAG
jgi:hypothetical protein